MSTVLHSRKLWRKWRLQLLLRARERRRFRRVHGRHRHAGDAELHVLRRLLQSGGVQPGGIRGNGPLWAYASHRIYAFCNIMAKVISGHTCAVLLPPSLTLSQDLLSGPYGMGLDLKVHWSFLSGCR